MRCDSDSPTLPRGGRLRAGVIATTVTLALTASITAAPGPDEELRRAADGSSTSGEDGDAPERDPIGIFNARILPIFRSPEPSSCVQCHLASVDLKSYIRPSQDETFASLRRQGLVDLEKPRDSKILRLIRMGADDLDEKARRIHETTRRAEYEAFAAWIEACCSDPRLRALAPAREDAVAGPERPDAVIRHARKSRVLDSFERLIWSQRMRCFPCHTPHELDPSDPRHAKPIERVAELERHFGAETARRLRIFKESPAETMRYLIEDSRETPEGRLPLLNLESPRDSLLVAKPTARLPPVVDGARAAPSYVAPVSHMGGLKMHVDDASYKAFVTWIDDYARLTREEYASADELPADDWLPTKKILMIESTPEAWKPGVRVQIAVHAWSESESVWSPRPVAFTQNSVTPRRRVVGPLFLIAGETTPRLEPGRYQIRAYVDAEGRLDAAPTILLGEEDLGGSVEILAHWREGFPNREVVSGDLLEVTPTSSAPRERDGAGP